LVLLVLVFHVGCQTDNGDTESSNPTLTDFYGDYLGQAFPGEIPVRFSTGSLLATDTWWWISPPKFSPDGREMYHTRYEVGNPDVKHFYFMEITDQGQWTWPQLTFFSADSGDCHMALSMDGTRLFFLSHRTGGPFFVVNKNTSGWSEPVPLNVAVDLPVGNQFSVTRNETLYFEVNNGPADDIYVARFENGVYREPENLGPVINTGDYEEYAPYIDPDEIYLIFASNRPGGYGGNDLYISFRNSGGFWSQPRNMGSSINTEGADTLPCVSPDGLYLFFVSLRSGDQGYNPYWVDSRIIDSLRE
jgi:hypothetical protein